MSSLAKRLAVPTRTPAAKPSVVAALDIGASKIACFIAKTDALGTVGRTGPLRVAGVGQQPSKGVRGGGIVDLEMAAKAVGAAVEQAERMAGTRITEAVVSVSGFGLAARPAHGEIGVGPGEVTTKDVRRVVAQALQSVRCDGRTVIHAVPVAYVLDGGKSISDPRGMMGRVLSVTLTVVSVPTSAWRNLILCVERAHLTVSGAVAGPYASALATLVDDDLNLGSICLDMGGASTSAAVFLNGSLVHVDAVPLGGQHVTNDVAMGLSTSYASAERVKILNGTVLASPNEENEMIDAPQLGDDGRLHPATAPRSLLTGVIRPRVEETLELLRDRLRAAGADRLGARRIVLTGGAAQLNGARELAARVFESPVRLARPSRYVGLADAVSGPAFAGSAGLLRWALERPADIAQRGPADSEEEARGIVSRCLNWVRQNF